MPLVPPNSPNAAADKRDWKVGGFIVAGILLLVAAVAPAVVLWKVVHPADAKTKARTVGAACAEKKATQSANNDAGVELQPNRARPTLTISLADKQSSVDSISFSAKNRLKVPDTKQTRVSAVFLETPRRSPAEPADSKIRAKATSEFGQRVVRLTVCVDRGALLKAGAFQGTVRIYGPQVADFDYAVVIAQKWPWQFAAATLWYAGLAFIIVAGATGSFAFKKGRSGFRDRWIIPAAGIAFGLVAMLPAFFGGYWNNPTWGSDPGTQLFGLATAGLTAALAGLAAAQKFLTE